MPPVISIFFIKIFFVKNCNGVYPPNLTYLQVLGFAIHHILDISSSIFLGEKKEADWVRRRFSFVMIVYFLRFDGRHL